MRERDRKPLPALQFFNRFTPRWPASLSVTDHENLASVHWCQIQSRAKLSQLCPTPCYPMDYDPPGSSVHGDSPDKNARVGCYALLQGIFPTRGLNACLLLLLDCRWIFYLWATGEASFRDKDLGEVGKNNFFTFLSKKENIRLMPQKLCVPTREDLVRCLIAVVQE